MFARRFAAPVRFLLFTLAFGISYALLPLYSWDQNTYFLHGLARAGYGLLRQDWLAGTTDPVPVFSLVVSLSYPISERLFYLYQFAILGVYLLGLTVIALKLFPVPTGARTRVTFMVLVLAIHSSVGHAVSVKLLGFDALRPLHEGLAAHDVIGPVFQPSAFAAFLILSVALFLSRRPILAVFSLGIAATVHPVYLLSGAALTVGYVVSLYRDERKVRKPFVVGVVALALVLPIVIYVLRSFSATSDDLMARALDILVNVRLPHHADPRVWFGAQSVVQVALVVAGLLIARRTRLFPIMLVTLLVGASLTLVQLLTGNLWLALISPWRVSVVLVPTSTACVLAWLIERFSQHLARHSALWLGATAALLAVLVIGGIVSMKRKFDARRNDPATPMMMFVREAKSPREVYLIPVELQDFRLTTGAPTFVDFKSHPYRDREVVAWYDRVQAARLFFGVDTMDCALLHELARQGGVTHVVSPAGRFGRSCEGLEACYDDGRYIVYRLRNRLISHP